MEKTKTNRMAERTNEWMDGYNCVSVNCDKIWDANDQVRSFSFSRIKILNFTEIEIGSLHFVETRNFISINKHVNYKTHLTVSSIYGKFEFVWHRQTQILIFTECIKQKSKANGNRCLPCFHTHTRNIVFRVISAWSYFIFIEIEFQMNKLVCQGVRVNC